MTAPVTTAGIWAEVERRTFGVVGFVTAKGEARTAGIVYLVRNRTVYFCTSTGAWKARHLRRNPSASMTVPVERRVLLAPWLKIPAATITFSGTCRVLDVAEVPAEIPDTLLKHLEPAAELRRQSSVVEMTPTGDFLTYGIGVSVRTMLSPEQAAGRAAVR